MKLNTVKYIVLMLFLAFVSRNETFAQEVSRSTAKRVAETFLNKNVRGGRGAHIQLQDITVETEFQNFYIFSADSGFVIVAADERVTPILGYSKTNRFVTEDMPDNLRCWLKGYDEQIQYAVDNQLPPSEKDVRQWNDLKTGQCGVLQTRITVGPLIETLWGQRGYTNGSSGDEIELYNQQCPKIAGVHCLPGCTAIALAQVMRYWRHPTYPHGTMVPYTPSNPQHPEFYPRGVSFDTCSYDWSKMPIILNQSTSQDSIDEVAKFLYQCAVSISSDFGVSETDATLPSVASALTDYFYYKPTLRHKNRFFYSNKKWKRMLKDDLSASPGRPVCYRGEYYDNENKRHAHAWVCDGYEEVGENDYFHFNFGWHGGSYGSGDPYNNYYSIDPINKYLHLQYIDYQAAIFGIEPEESTITSTVFPAGGGMVIGSGCFRKGSMCTLTATPNDNCVFSNWTKNGQVVSIEPEFSFIVIENATYVANFKREHTINVEAMPLIGGTVEGGGVYLDGDQCTITATPNPGYFFKGWYTPAGLFPVNPLPTFTFTVSSNMHLIAKFQPVTPTTDVYQYYCWFDQDYSTVQTGSFQTTETFFSLDASALSEGLHTLHVMLDDNGLSAPKTFLFMKAPATSLNSTYQYHCWFDQDYGTVQTGTFGGEGFSFALDANALEEGIHTVHVMLEGDDLSASKTYMFLKAPVASSTATYTYHYWFDQDYGTVQTGTFGGEGYCFAIDASALDNGLHFLNVMLEGDDLTASKRYLFNKVPIGGEGITRWEYCLNGDWSDATVTDLVPTVSTLDIIAMLPVDPQPIRSQSFEFQINNGQPEVYAKNYITFRFWDAENRFIDRSAEYVDETVHENVVAEWIERNTTRTIVTPGPNQIHWFKLDASLGNLMEFMADHECTIQLFSPSGELAFSSMSVASIVFNGSYAREEGVFYLAVHDVEEGYDNISITYRYTGTTTPTQNVALSQGPNWFSTYLEITKEDLQNALLDVLSNPTGAIIKSQDGNSTYRGGRWRDQNFVWDVAKMYMIVAPEDCEITMTGLPINPADHPITIAPNAPTWIGFPFAESKTPAQAIPAGFAVNGDIIKGMGGNIRYNNGSWRAQGMNSLEPGKGYIYNSKSAVSRTLVFPTSKK